MNTTVLVSNFAHSVDASTLEDMFSTVGDVRSARVINSLGYVEMTTREEMENCIQHFNGQMKNGMALMVREDKVIERQPIPLKVAKPVKRA